MSMTRLRNDLSEVYRKNRLFYLSSSGVFLASIAFTTFLVYREFGKTPATVSAVAPTMSAVTLPTGDKFDRVVIGRTYVDRTPGAAFPFAERRLATSTQERSVTLFVGNWNTVDFYGAEADTAFRWVSHGASVLAAVPDDDQQVPDHDSPVSQAPGVAFVRMPAGQASALVVCRTQTNPVVLNYEAPGVTDVYLIGFKAHQPVKVDAYWPGPVGGGESSQHGGDLKANAEGYAWYQLPKAGTYAITVTSQETNP